MPNFDIYSTAAMLKAIELMPREYTFLNDVFAADGGVVEDDKAIYDFRKGAKRMAPFVTKNAGAVVMERDGYETREIGFATIAPKRVVDIAELEKRYFGEAIMGAMTPEQRAKKMLAKDLTEMRQAIQRRREWMVMQVLLTGKLNIFRYTNEGRDIATTLVADYGFTNNFTPDTDWDQAGADIYGDLQEIYNLVYDGLGNVDVIVMAPDVANAMLANETFMKTFDRINADMGQINTKYRGQGVRFIGRNADGVEMYSFAGKYVDDDGLVKPYLPSGKLIAGGKGMLNMVHGPVTQVEGYGDAAKVKTYIKKEVPLHDGNQGGNAVTNQITSCPTVVPFNVDAWAVATVLQ